MASLNKWGSVRDVTGFALNYDPYLGGDIENEKQECCAPPPMESYRTGGAYIVRVDLPGVDPKQVQLIYQDGYLAIEGERKRSAYVGEQSLLREGVCYGPFRRTLYIPAGIKGEEITARYRDGVLEITAPLDEKSVPQRIKVEEVAG